MPRLGGSLSCFYCGKKSSVKFDGSIRDFLCLHCDATNYLDKNGEITDPPVAKTTSVVEPAQYATIRQQSPVAATSPSQDIFCSTCQKNQHLFTASLAQYLPDDPDHPDYARLERDYYKYRKSLEQLYPQICADCFPKVQAQVDRAGYTARTDHLRRMMDKSRQRRATPKQWSPLNTMDAAGKWLWLGGLVCQLLWHLVLVSQASSPSTSDPLRDPDEVPHWFQTWLVQVTNWLPEGECLSWYSILASVLSAWWNPRFVQVFRGFSKHVLGLSQWYAFQALILAVRLGGRQAAGHVAQTGVGTNANVSLHGLLAIITIACYWKAQGSVHIDTTPLFQSDASPMPTPPRVKGPARAAQKQDTQSLAGMLDEIMQQPPKNVMEIPTRPTRSPLAQSSGRDKENVGMGGLALSERPPQYSEEMDWSPTQSKHRAFNDFGAPGRDKQGFNAAPANVDSGAFWYKVPPAPKAPLHKLATASTAVIREKPAESSSNSFFSFGNRFNAGKPASPSGNAAESSKVDFAQPSFFAAPNTSDPRNSLADILDSKFTIGQDDADDETRREGAKYAEIELKPQFSQIKTSSRSSRFADMLLLAILLSTWWCATAYEELQPYTRETMMITMGLELLVSMHMTRTAMIDLQAATLQRRQLSTLQRRSLTGNVLLGVCEVVICGLLMLQMWTTSDARLLGEMRWTGLISMTLTAAHGTTVYLGPKAHAWFR